MTRLQSQEGEGRWLAITLRSAVGWVKAVSYPYLIDAAFVQARFGFVQQTQSVVGVGSATHVWLLSLPLACSPGQLIS